MAGLLSAAACVIASEGYDAATMSAIARRAGASIGSLYQFFPNKDAVARALCAEYGREVDGAWGALQTQAGTLSRAELVERYVEIMVNFMKGHPEFLPLMDSPSSAHTPGTRLLLRERLADVLVSHAPRLKRAKAMRIADVILHINKGLMFLYARSDREAGDWVVEQFKSALGGYLASELGR